MLVNLAFLMLFYCYACAGLGIVMLVYYVAKRFFGVDLSQIMHKKLFGREQQ